MTRTELEDCLRREITKWSRKPLDALLQELERQPSCYLSERGAARFLTEVSILLKTDDDVCVTVTVSDLREPSSHGASGGFRVYRNGRTDTYVARRK